MNLLLCTETENSNKEPFYEYKTILDFHYFNIVYKEAEGMFLPFDSVKKISEHLKDSDTYIEYLKFSKLNLLSTINDLNKINNYLKIKLLNNDIQFENDNELLKISKRRRVLGNVKWVLISFGAFVTGGLITAIYIIFRYIPLNFTTGLSGSNNLKIRF